MFLSQKPRLPRSRQSWRARLQRQQRATSSGPSTSRRRTPSSRRSRRTRAHLVVFFWRKRNQAANPASSKYVKSKIQKIHKLVLLGPFKLVISVYIYAFSLNRHTGPIKSLSCYVRQLCVCFCHRVNTASLWTGDVLLILAYLQKFLSFCRFNNYLRFDIFSGFGVLANQPTVHNGGVSRGRVCGWVCWRQ